MLVAYLLSGAILWPGAPRQVIHIDQARKLLDQSEFYQEWFSLIVQPEPAKVGDRGPNRTRCE